MDTIPAALTDMLGGFATYYGVAIAALLWRNINDGLPPDTDGMTRRQIFERYTLLTSRAVDGETYALYRRNAVADAAPTA